MAKILRPISILVVLALTLSLVGMASLFIAPTEVSAHTGGSDAYGYMFIDSTEPGGPTYSWVEISGTGTATGLSDDDYTGAIPLGFNFNYYGTNYNNVYIMSNGWISFVDQDSWYPTSGFPSADGYVAPISPLSNDLNPGCTGEVYYETLGTAPNRTFVVEWYQVPRYSCSGSNTFEIILYEASNDIKFQYHSLTHAGNVGIEDQTETIGLDYPYFPSGGLAILFSATDTDGDGMADIWEDLYGLNKNNPADAAQDLDGDGLTNLEECQNGTDPTDLDTDDDGLADGQEVNVYGTNPARADTDGGGVNDGDEIARGTDPLDPWDDDIYRVFDNTGPGGPTYGWIDITTTGTDTGITEDDEGAVVPIGFSFLFYGNTYTQVGISSNGYLTFGTELAECSNDCIPDTDDPNDAIFPFWDDLYPPSGGTIYYETRGAAPNRMFILEWCDVPHISDTGTPRSHFTFEAILYESSNNIIFQYQNMQNGTQLYADGSSATVGIENIDGIIGLEYSCNEVGAISNGLAILFSPSIPPPLADFTAAPRQGAEPLTVQFTDLSTGVITSWLWHFGDGEASREQHPSHIYNYPGTYTVTLSVEGPGGTDIEMKTDYIEVIEEVEPARIIVRNLQIQPANALPGQQVVISADVVNQGGGRGSKNIELVINGQVEQSTRVGVDPGAAQHITFYTSKTVPGTYEVYIEGQESAFNVLLRPHVTSTGAFEGLGTGAVIAIVVIGVILLAGIIFVFIRVRR